MHWLGTCLPWLKAVVQGRVHRFRVCTRPRGHENLGASFRGGGLGLGHPAPAVGACWGHAVFFGWRSLGRQSELGQTTDRLGPGRQVRLPGARQSSMIRSSVCVIWLGNRTWRRSDERHGSDGGSVSGDAHETTQRAPEPSSAGERGKSVPGGAGPTKVQPLRRVSPSAPLRGAAPPGRYCVPLGTSGPP